MTEANTELPVISDKSAVPAARDLISLHSLRREIDRLFEEYFPIGWRLPSRGGGTFEINLPNPMAAWALSPAFNLVEKDKEYELTAELPGMDEENVEIKLNNTVLTVRGEKLESKEEQEKDYFLSERRFGSFQRSFQVPSGVDPEKIEATFSSGLLTVRLPKTSEAQQAGKRIAIKPA